MTVELKLLPRLTVLLQISIQWTNEKPEASTEDEREAHTSVCWIHIDDETLKLENETEKVTWPGLSTFGYCKATTQTEDELEDWLKASNDIEDNAIMSWL